ncbi:hypothetical protein AND4_01968 [Vibrio sp. AND4]|nr:hypothetical protein AND4_01968 [Vibrio sp. AND4]
MASIFVLPFLSACNGGEENHTGSELPIPIDTAAIYSENVSMYGIAGKNNTVELAKHVSISDGSDFSVESVKSISGDDCKIANINANNFEVYSDEVKDCIYQYNVSPTVSSNKSKSYTRVAFGKNYSSSFLPKIVASTTLGEPLLIDLKRKLGASFPGKTFVLQDDIVSAGGDVERIKSDKLSFSPTENGTSVVYFSYSNGEKLLLGTLVVSVSAITDPLKADNFEYSNQIKVGEKVTIDVAHHVEGGNEDYNRPQLIAVEDFNSTLKLTDPTNILNTKFDFSSQTPGNHDVAYTVTDHLGNYTTALVRVEVEPDFSLIQDWEDIVVHDSVINSDIRFFAPMSKVFADYVKAPYTSINTENGDRGPDGVEIVTQTLQQARDYCKTRGGRLPLQREVDALIAQEGNAFEKHNWPTEITYWTSEKASEANAITKSLFDGTVGQNPQNEAQYTTCVDMSNPKVQGFNVSLELQHSEDNEYQYFLTAIGPDGDVAPYQDVELAVNDDKGHFDSQGSTASYVTDDIGHVAFSYFDTSFNRAIMTVSLNSLKEWFPFRPVWEITPLEVTDPSKWNHVDTRYGTTGKIPGIGNQGIPILYSIYYYRGMGSSTVYKTPFKGDEFMMVYRIRNLGGQHGSVSFFIQQVGNLPNKNDWYDINEPGAPHTSKTLNIVQEYYENRIYIHNGFGNQIANKYNANDNDEYRYYWWQKKGDKLYHYASEKPEIPSEPIFVINYDWGDIDPNQPYWVGFGGATSWDQNDLQAYISEASFGSY